ncbi:uncharacterized protein LOC144094717 [Amblyomma americanum]
MVYPLNPTALSLLLLLLIACAAVNAAPPPKGGASSSAGNTSSPAYKPAAASPSQGYSGGLFDAIKTTSLQLQHTSDKFPVTYNMAATRFQSWAQENNDSISKTAAEVFNLARTIFKPLEAELRKRADSA